jgi:hypothetical protein
VVIVVTAHQIASPKSLMLASGLDRILSDDTAQTGVV